MSAVGASGAVQWLCIVRCHANGLVIMGAVTTRLQAGASILWLIYCTQGLADTSVVSHCCGKHSLSWSSLQYSHGTAITLPGTPPDIRGVVAAACTSEDSHNP